MQWTPVDLGTIARILDLMAVDQSAVEIPGLHLRHARRAGYSGPRHAFG